MGNPKFYYFPFPNGGQLRTIDVGEPLAELFSDFQVDAATSVALNGGLRRTTGTHREVVTIQRDRLKLGEDLVVKFAALQNHLDRGYSCSFAQDSDKAYCFPSKRNPQRGTSIPVDGDPFRGYTGGTTPSANDYVVVESLNPELVYEQGKLTAGPSSAALGGAMNFVNPLSFAYRNPVYIRYYRFWPALKRPQSQIGQNIITNETGRLFSLNLTLVVDYDVLFSFHPNIAQTGNDIPWATTTGFVEGTQTLDATPLANDGRRESTAENFGGQTYRG